MADRNRGIRWLHHSILRFGWPVHRLPYILTLLHICNHHSDVVTKHYRDSYRRLLYRLLHSWHLRPTVTYRWKWCHSRRSSAFWWDIQTLAEDFPQHSIQASPQKYCQPAAYPLIGTCSYGVAFQTLINAASTEYPCQYDVYCHILSLRPSIPLVYKYRGLMKHLDCRFTMLKLTKPILAHPQPIGT